MRKVSIILISMFILLFIAGCGSSEQNSNSTEMSVATEPVETTQPNPFSGYGISDDQVKEYWKNYAGSLSIEEYAEMCTIMSEPNAFDDDNISDELISIYWKEFAKFYSIEEYIELCNISIQISAVPETAVNSNLFLAVRDLSTYNKIEKNALLLNTAGEIIREYEDTEESEYLTYIPSTYKIGKYSIVSTNASVFEMDVFNDSGDFVGAYPVTEGIIDVIFAIGDEYYVFVPKNSRTHCLQMIQPTGDIYYVDTDYYNNPPYDDLLNGNVAVGKMSESMFSLRYEYILDTYAYYFDIYGDVVIDLSEEVVNFEVLELGEFSNGQAVIKFKGADLKVYTGIINTYGEFITPPKSE